MTGWSDESGSLDRGAYMAWKEAKQRDQFGGRRERRGAWFAGEVVWINGHTQPVGPAALQDLVLEGGGLVENTDARTVTVCVAETLSRAQIQKLNERKRGFSRPVVTPAWVLDCRDREAPLDKGPYELFSQAPSARSFAIARDRPPRAAAAAAGAADGDPPDGTAAIVRDRLLAAVAAGRASDPGRPSDDSAPWSPTPSSLGASPRSPRPSTASSDSALARRVGDEERSRRRFTGDSAFARELARELARGGASDDEADARCARDAEIARELEAEVNRRATPMRRESIRGPREAASPAPPEDEDAPGGGGGGGDRAADGPPLFGCVERFQRAGPAVAAWLGEAEPEAAESVLLLNELLAVYVGRGALEDAAAVLRLVEDVATHGDGRWRAPYLLLRDLADAMVADAYGYPLATRGIPNVRPDFAFMDDE